MEDHPWRDELWRFTDETEATLVALAPAPGPAGERQEAVVEMDADSDLRKLLKRHPLP